MRLLPDTHALIWFLEDDARLGRQARAAICDGANESPVSDATAWEAGIKHSLGKLRLPAPFEELFPGRIIARGISCAAHPPHAPARTGASAPASPRCI